MKKKLKILLHLYQVTNDNFTLLNGRLDLFYNTYYQVVVLCTVKRAHLSPCAWIPIIISSKVHWLASYYLTTDKIVFQFQWKNCETSNGCTKGSSPSCSIKKNECTKENNYSVCVPKVSNSTWTLWRYIIRVVSYIPNNIQMHGWSSFLTGETK